MKEQVVNGYITFTEANSTQIKLQQQKKGWTVIKHRLAESWYYMEPINSLKLFRLKLCHTTFWDIVCFECNKFFTAFSFKVSDWIEKTPYWAFILGIGLTNTFEIHKCVLVGVWYRWDTVKALSFFKIFFIYFLTFIYWLNIIVLFVFRIAPRVHLDNVWVPFLIKIILDFVLLIFMLKF
jgi:hypothetical protein